MLPLTDKRNECTLFVIETFLEANGTPIAGQHLQALELLSLETDLTDEFLFSRLDDQSEYTVLHMETRSRLLQNTEKKLWENFSKVDQPCFSKAGQVYMQICTNAATRILRSASK